MHNKPYILTIGDIVTDAFIKLIKEEEHVTKDADGNKWLAFPLGAKPPYDSAEEILAVGNSANAAVSISRLGLDAGLMAYMGDDNAGKKMLSYLSEENVDTNTISVAEGMKSNYHYVLRYGAERTILIKYEDYNYTWQEPERTPDWIYLSMLSENSWGLHEQVLSYLEHHPETKLVFQPGTFHFEWGAQKLAAFYARAHMVFMNVEEAMLVTNKKSRDLEILSQGLHDLGVKIAVITDGPDGAYASDGKKIIHMPNYPDPSEPIDRTGAGDAFASTVMAAVATGENLETALRWAAINSMNVCQNLGAQAGLLRKDDIDRLLQEAPEEFKPTIIAGEKESSLEEIAQKLVQKPKGIFAADQSGGSVGALFNAIELENNEENRRLYRQIFFTTPQIENYISGVILYDETARQSTDDGTAFTSILESRGIIPGIKVDKGIVDLPGFSGEGVTSGLDGLSERLAEYRSMGLRFAKWRAALFIDENTPSEAAIAANIHALARYAKECQNADIVPIVEPEIVFAGNHDIETCKRVTATTLDALFDELALLNVNRKATILKTSMVLAGSNHPEQSTPEQVAHATVEVLANHVPHDLAGVVFLSGGQEAERATKNLQAITDTGPQAWPITFSFARALQVPTIERWKGKPENVHAAQETFLARIQANSNATKAQH